MASNSIYFNTEPNSSQPIGGLRKDFTELGSGAFTAGPISIPYIVIIRAAGYLPDLVLFNKTAFGKSLYAIGGNPEAARVSGINVTRILVIIYALAGAMYGLAGTFGGGPHRRPHKQLWQRL